MEGAQKKQLSDKSDKSSSQSDHLKEKPYTCNVCHKTFTQRITLDRHSALHANKKPFSCYLCKKSYYLRFDLVEHYKSHAEEKKTYSCEKCNEKFSKLGQLNKHRLVHADQSLLDNLVEDQASKPKVAKKRTKLKVPKKRKKIKISPSLPLKKAKKDTMQIPEDFEKHNLVMSEVFHSSGVIENCFNTLHNMCEHAIQFKKHAHRDHLTVSDIHRASSSKLCDSSTSDDLTDLKTLVDQPNDCVENEKVFYQGKCLHNLIFDILKDQIPSENLRNYFKFILESAFKGNDDLLIYSLTDLKRNPYISPLLPVFIQSICNNLILLNYPPTQLQKFLLILHSLHQNPNLYFGNKNLYQLVNFITSCINSKLKLTSFSQEEYCYFKKCASEILKSILETDCIQIKNLYASCSNK